MEITEDQKINKKKKFNKNIFYSIQDAAAFKCFIFLLNVKTKILNEDTIKKKRENEIKKRKIKNKQKENN